VKRAISLTAYVAIAVADAAIAQSGSDHLKTVKTTVETTGYIAPIPSPPVLKEIAVKPVPIERPPETVEVSYGRGGRVDEHNLKYGAYRRANVYVKVTGPCYSACTLVTAYISKDKLCFAEGAFLAFHAVRSLEKREIMPAATALMYWQQPEDIRSWIDRTGGHQNLPLDGFWPLYDRELWAMGYPRCAP
jgi:hypothetical protein